MSEADMDLQAIQNQFTRHIRDPDNSPAPADIEPRRMAIYKRLLYGNVENFMANSFPVLRKVTPDERWHQMIRDYFKNHLSQTPLFPKMPQEFLDYLERERDAEGDPPFLLELARYEWAEMLILLDRREIDLTGVNMEGDVLHGIPVINSIIMLMTFEYPVHKISPEYMPDSLPSRKSYIVIYRDLDYKVGFLELNAVSAKLLNLLRENVTKEGLGLIEEINAELNHPDPEVVRRGGIEIMQDLRHRNIILGTKK